jgi:hypothetical protein
MGEGAGGRATRLRLEDDRGRAGSAPPGGRAARARAGLAGAGSWRPLGRLWAASGHSLRPAPGGGAGRETFKRPLLFDLAERFPAVCSPQYRSAAGEAMYAIADWQVPLTSPRCGCMQPERLPNVAPGQN